MSLLAEYQTAHHTESLARLRRVLALRAMLATGTNQREIAAALGISQSAISQQTKTRLAKHTDPVTLVDAAGPILRDVAAARGWSDLAVFGSVARRDARPDSDVDLIVRPPAGTTIKDVEAMRRLLETILERPVDLITYGGLAPGIDDDILREAILL
ncbi:MAG: nucleotidyltransferase domain-containing protein [Propionibacteriaceae bacterium]|jgi:predicted nucleotidyltransferase|nr:nucleotidyltransferase domain-containing protein [Propionibacteriaceae bacterium]